MSTVPAKQIPATGPAESIEERFHRLEDVFPGLRGQAYQIMSPRDDSYNCIAWAAGDNRAWWWPDPAGEDAWPAGALRAETVAAFHDAFATLGYVVCDHEQPEGGYEKI